MSITADAHAEVSRQALTVLLVEDDPHLRADMSELIATLGWQLTPAATADEALALIRSGRMFDLVVTDVNTPGQADGYDLAVFTRVNFPNVRVVIMSSEMKPDFGGPFDIFLGKPVDDIAKVLQELMRDAETAS